jgi:Type VI secretion system/phage-baseplate injector OB domain
MTAFFGKYRGKVENNVDPLQLGRVQVSVPAVLGSGTLNWALPCVPYAGPQVGFFAIPPKGANIWVEFEGGDPDYPIWSGCFWGSGEMPLDPALAEHKMLRTEGITLSLNDGSGGGVSLSVDDPAVSTPITVELDDNGVCVTDDKTKVTLTPSDCTIENDKVSFHLTGSEIELTTGDIAIKLDGSDLALSNGSVSVKLSSSELQLTTGTPLVKLSGSGVELSNGGSNVKVESATVSVNNGALEVM